MRFPLPVTDWPIWVKAAIIAIAIAIILYGGLAPLPVGADEPCIPTSPGYVWEMPIKYRIEGLKRADVHKAIAAWESVSLRFRENADAKSVFKSGSLPPGIIGAVTLIELDFKTPVRFEITVDLKQAGFVSVVAVVKHEIGHALQLYHTKCTSSVMYPIIFEHKGLGAGDILSRDRLYPINRIYLPSISK